MDPSRALTAVLWLFLFITAVGLAGKAAQTPFSSAEVLTLALAELPPGPQLWHEVATGPGLSPPAAALATRTSETWLGRGPVSSRLASIVCAIAVMLGVFRVAARQGGPDAGFAAIFALSFSGLMPHFAEARPYALVFAGAMGTWFCWQGLIAQPRFRKVKLAGVTAGMKLAIVSHASGLVLPVCFALGIVARGIRLRKVDWAALAATLAPLSLAVAYKPLLEAARRMPQSAAGSLGEAYLHALGYLPLLAGGAGVAAGIVWFTCRAEHEGPRHFCPEDYVVAASLLGAPVLLWKVSNALGLPWSPGQALLAGLGLAFLFGQAMAGAARRKPLTSRALLAGVGMGLVATHIYAVLSAS